MQENPISTSKNPSDESERAVEMDKYLSLISTLKGQEEYLLDEKGIIISSNLEAVNITGYEEFEIIGEHLSKFYPKEEKEKANDDLKKAAAFGYVVVSGMRLKKRGTTFWAKIKIRYVAEGQSRVVFRVLLQDTTHRALSNLRVQSVRDEYLAIFNNPFVGSFKFRMNDYRLLMWNKKAEEITGRTESKEIFFNRLFLMQDEFLQFISQLKEQRRIEGLKFRTLNIKTNEDRWLMICASYFVTQGFAEGILLDITEQHNQMVELQRVNTELDNFTYHASHDLRAPLTTVLGLVNLGLMEKESSQTYFEMIRNRISHMDGLLKDLISVSYNNKKEMIYEYFFFEKEITEIVKEYDFPGNRCKVEMNCLQKEEFVTDGVRMRTILRNLISNAFKYQNPELENPFVQIRVKVNREHSSIQLTDNGIGIEWSHKERVYDMFYRATSRSNGTGLGLYIVKSMIEKLTGQISLESTFGQGTTFQLVIPNQMNKMNNASLKPVL
jgi:PAS domain S-box-containing protein